MNPSSNNNITGISTPLNESLVILNKLIPFI